MEENVNDINDNKIVIKRSANADTRSATGEVTKKSLLQNTYSHISDVQRWGEKLAEKLIAQTKIHDHTKIEYIDQFYEDFTSGRKGSEFKELPWWSIHKTERHHLNDSVPEDVNLIDVMEMVIDCTVAGLARSGNVYEIKIDPEVLQRAINNTSRYIINNSIIEDTVDKINIEGEEENIIK